MNANDLCSLMISAGGMGFIASATVLMFFREFFSTHFIIVTGIGVISVLISGVGILASIIMEGQ